MGKEPPSHEELQARPRRAEARSDTPRRDRDVFPESASLEPGEEVFEHGLSAVLHLPTFQSLFEAFTETTGLATALLDMDGDVLVATGWQDICMKFHRIHPQTAQNCTESDLYLTGKVTQGEFAAYRCKNQLWDVVTPLVVGDRHVGNVYTGQFFYDDDIVDRGAFAARAVECGFDQNAYFEALGRVPRVSRDKVTRSMRLLVQMATVLAENAYSSLKLAHMISRHMESEEALRESAERNRTILKSAMDGFWLADLEGRLLQVNEVYCLTSGYTEQELLEMSIADLEAVETPADTAAHIRRFVTEGEGRFESRHRRKNGTEFDVEVSVQYLPMDGGRLVIFLRDVTERRRGEDALRKSEEKYRLLFENMSEGFVLHEAVIDEQGNVCDFLIVEANPASEGMTGMKPGSLMGRTLREIAPETPWVGRYASVALTGAPSHFRQYSTKFGRWYEVFTYQPKPGQCASVLADITERVLAEEELEKHRRHLERLVEERTAELDARVVEVEKLNEDMSVVMERMRASQEELESASRALQAMNRELDAFSYSVSHDLRAPLRHVDGFVRLLLEREEGRLDVTSTHYLQTVAESSARMGRLIDDLLAFSRTSRAGASFQCVDSNDVVRVARAELLHLMEGRRIEWDVESLPPVLADRDLLRLVWQNLIANAIKYTAPRDVARIAIGTICTEDAEDADMVTFFIRDNGVGFEQQYKDKLFGVFQRLHRADEFEGTGIGLATVKRIIHRHGGRVWAEGGVDRGATFFFSVKRAGEDANDIGEQDTARR